MRAWIIDPMHKLLSLGEGRLVIILDGLDECGDQEELESLMKLVLFLDELPAAFSVLVSSRPESSVVSAWARARAQGLEEKSNTVRCMVEEGLRGCIDKSSWKPSKQDVDAFVLACRGLPIIASIRVRDVSIRTRHGATLRSEFKYFRDLIDAPVDVNLEYLRVLRRAYIFDSSGVLPHIAENYRQVVATINAAFEPLSVFFISQLSGIAEEEVLAILDPIRSIVDLSSKSGSERSSESPPESSSEEMQGVKFYHATMKEFITGDPIGNENDKVFFIRDANKYFIGLPLLRIFNNSCERDVFADPTSSPLRHERNWHVVDDRKHHRPHHLQYAREYLLEHLDPSQLFAQESNLQTEFNTFLTRNLVTFMHLALFAEAGKGFPDGFDKFKNCDSYKLLKEAREKQFVEYMDAISLSPWHLHRSTLPFTPSSSPLYKLYGYLSDPVRIFTISGEFSGHRIPLSEDLLNARMVMEAKLPNLPEKAGGRVNYDAQFNDRDVRNGIITCAALSLDGRHVALGFGSGVVELADIDQQRMISRFQLNPPNHPVWIEFVHGSHQVADEDNEGNVTILRHDMTPINLGTLPNGSPPAITQVSDNGLFIIRVPWNTDSFWYDSLTLISILGDPHMQHLAPPSSNNSTPTSNPPILASESSTSSSTSINLDVVLAVPHRRTLGFSPSARYIGVFDGLSAFTWSTDSEGGAADRHHSETDAGNDLDESWIKCPFYVLLQSGWDEWGKRWRKSKIRSSAAGRTPLFRTSGYAGLPVLFNGEFEFVIPKEYQPVVSSGAKDLGAWYGDQVPSDPTLLYSPRSSKDGTRILLQGRQTAPIVIDLSQVI
ncbi:uncharacterized protein EI90DRAFT_3059824 [Cantharellus anzutake]|uniref:uncharacterized protein n=1 Tax=Cantharellus anzutake TaxID=1750568 RepID=UPI00190434CB|nr:uncharacterized protein EI90DRAFT_3059824 [Cantharellus anzutake]KAF8330915.1 hypothetical protein EI90DRAFT_3059824 [Cantharellus anzutake]